ncbi:alpha/beta hydrolase [Pseudomonas saxonica]|uniref:alpha/beta hydrolase n=1 Tax=Pseudomonas saxonica TaxID=2600598 RepID=UPI002D76A229|nr:AAA family ATPase [Pseudomonas saxonica]WRQ75036.1 AAA family ATPase [Pseudomonas saxonica]
MPRNNSWYHYNQNTDTIMVFVHGFFSNSAACWHNKKINKSWPELVKDDSRIQNISIYMGGYYTNVDSGNYAVRECSQELFDSLRRVDHIERKPPLSFQKIIFVCHSLGGIVVRYMLECFRENFKSHKIGLVLMASPSIGSDYADKLSKFAALYKNRTATQLQMNSELLSDLDDRFKDFIDERERDSFFGVEGTEHVGFMHLRWLPGFKPIVLKHSSSRYFAASRTVPGTNHSSIVKPTDIDHGSHRLLLDFLNNTFFPKAGMPQLLQKKALIDESIPLINGYTSQGPLFDVYDDSCEPFYLNRKIDDQVRLDFQHNSFWIWGPSGSGKTSVVKRLLGKAGFRSIDMCFSQCLNGNYRYAFISEMVETLHLSEFGPEGMPEKTVNNLARQISDGISDGKYLFIYIDEVPRDDGDDAAEKELALLIEDLLTSIKQIAKANSFRFVISSLGKPDLMECRNPAKVSGYLRVIECAKWTSEDLVKLVGIISDYISPLHAGVIPGDLVAEAKGSPRFIKSFFKTKLAYPDRDNEELIRMTMHGFQF